MKWRLREINNSRTRNSNNLTKFRQRAKNEIVNVLETAGRGMSALYAQYIKRTLIPFNVYLALNVGMNFESLELNTDSNENMEPTASNLPIKPDCFASRYGASLLITGYCP